MKILYLVSSNLSKKQNKLNNIIKGYSNITIPSEGHIQIDSFSGLDLSTSDYLISMTIRGWALIQSDSVCVYKGSDGTDIYLKGKPNTTIGSIYIEYWYFS